MKSFNFKCCFIKMQNFALEERPENETITEQCIQDSFKE